NESISQYHVTTKCFMSLRSPTENENDNASHLESFGYAQDKLRERSFFTPFFKGVHEGHQGFDPIYVLFS
ncbi:MAG TPA: hypothetical protein VKH62_15220, partial [Candidatus Binatia bacterium]|nr:hypothetical protein [Candidatus Binatia bacterium]